MRSPEKIDLSVEGRGRVFTDKSNGELGVKMVENFEICNILAESKGQINSYFVFFDDSSLVRGCAPPPSYLPSFSSYFFIFLANWKFAGHGILQDVVSI
jgi:hypothetical protein